MKTKKIFPGQGEDEKVIKVLFRHVFILIKNEFMPVVLFLASIIVMSFFFYLYPPFVFLFAFVVFLLSITWGFYSYFTWVRDKYIITDQRIVDVEQITLFARSQREAPLERVQDVAYEIKGFWGAILKFGTVTIQTAGEAVLTLDDVPDPEKIQKIIFDLIKEKKGEEDENKGIIKKMIDMLKRMGAKESDIRKELEERSGIDSEEGREEDKSEIKEIKREDF